MPRMRKYGESKTTRIMIGTVSHVNSVSEHRKFQADGFFRQNVQFLLLKSPFISILVLEFFLMMIMMMMVMMIYRNVNQTATMWFSSNRAAFNRNCPHNRDNIAPGMQKALPILPATFCPPTHIPYSYQLRVGCVWIDKNNWHYEGYISVILEWDQIYLEGRRRIYFI